MFRSLVSRDTVASPAWETDRILHWSTVYTAGWTPWSLSPETRKTGPQRQRVLRLVDGGGDGDDDGDDDGDGDGHGGGGGNGDVVLLFPRCSPRRTRSHRWEDATQRTTATCTLISARSLLLPMYARMQSTPVNLALLLVTPRSFSHPFFRLPPSSAHLSTFNPLARSRSSARPSRS